VYNADAVEAGTTSQHPSLHLPGAGNLDWTAQDQEQFRDFSAATIIFGY